MEKEICRIYIGNGVLDNDYIFFENGKIKNEYDQSTYKYNLEEWVTPSQISDSKKEKLILKCPEKHKERITKILYPS